MTTTIHRSDIDSRRLVRQCLRIAEIYDELIPTSGADPHRYAGVNPWNDERRTRSGLCLEVYYGIPSRLWTPWGWWLFSGAASHTVEEAEAELERFLSRLTVRLRVESEQGEWGHFGPVYEVQAVEGDAVERMELPDPGSFLRGEERIADARSKVAEWARFGGPWTESTPEGRIRHVDGKSTPVEQTLGTGRGL